MMLRRVMVGALVFLWAGLAQAEEGDFPKNLYVAPAEVKSWQGQGRQVFFLDVREADEFEAGHLPGAKNILWTEVASLIRQLPTDRPIVTYCIHSAHRAPEAAKTLRKLGFPNVYVLEGGIVAWQAGGLTLHASDIAKAPAILPVQERCKAAAKKT